MPYLPNLRRLAAVLTLLCALLGPMSVHGTELGPETDDVVLTIQPGQMGSFVVDLFNGNPTADLDVSSYAFTLTATAGPLATGLSFTAVDFAPNYIFSTSTAQTAGMVSSDTFPNLTFDAADTSTPSGSFAAIPASATVNLVTVIFAASPDATVGGVYTLAFSNFTIMDSTNSPETVDTTGMSTITIVPEPGSLALCGLAGLGGLVGYVRVRRSVL